MSRFLQSLVARHLPDVPAATSALQVQPRPKSRFEETSSEAEGSAMQESAGVQPGPPGASAGQLDEAAFATSTAVRQPLRARAQTQAPGDLAKGITEALPAREASPPGAPSPVSGDGSHPNAASRSAPVVGRSRSAADSALLHPLPDSPVLPAPSGPRAQPFLTPGPIASIPLMPTTEDPGARRTDALTNRKADVTSPRASPPSSMIGDESPYLDAVTQRRAHQIEPRPREHGEQQDSTLLRGAELLAPAWLADVQQALRAAVNSGGAKPVEEPSITVTIGQVEVRAEISAKAHRGSTADAPSGIMTLETYLKQRDRGR